MYYALGVAAGVFIGFVWAMCRAAAKVAPAPPKREGWVTTEDGPNYVEDVNKY